MPLQEWQELPSGRNDGSSDHFRQPAAPSGFGISRDIKSLILVILSIATITGVLYQWGFPEKRHVPPPTPDNSSATKPSPLLPFCPPEQDECWR